MTAQDWKAERMATLEARIKIQQALLESLETEMQELIELQGETLELRASYDTETAELAHKQVTVIKWMFVNFKHPSAVAPSSAPHTATVDALTPLPTPPNPASEAS